MAQPNSSTTWQKKGFGWIPDLPDIADPSLTLALDNKPRILSREGTDHLEGIANILSTLLKDKDTDESKQLEEVYNQILGETRFPNVQVYKILRKPEAPYSQESTQIQQAQAKEIVQLKQALYWIYRESIIHQRSQSEENKDCNQLLPKNLFPEDPKKVIEWLQTPHFDDRLEAVVKHFQRQHQLVEDGLVGLRTYIVLKAKLANSNKLNNEQNVELLCPSSIIPHDILEEVFQQLTYIWLCAKFSFSIDQAFEYFSGQYSLAPNQNEYSIRIRVELHAIVRDRLKEISSKFRKKVKPLSTEATLDSREEAIQHLKEKLTKLKEQLTHKCHELAVEAYQELDSQFRIDDCQAEDSIQLDQAEEIPLPKSVIPIFRELHKILEFSLNKLNHSLCNSDFEKALLHNSFIIYSDDDFINQFHTWFHIIEPFVSAIFQILSPLANFDNYRQAVGTGFNKLDSCFQLYQLEYESKIAAYKNLFLEYSPSQTASQIEELQDLRKTITTLFQETLAKINRICGENLNYRPHLLKSLEEILIANVEQLKVSSQAESILVKKWKNRAAKVPAAWLDKIWQDFHFSIENQLSCFSEEDKKEIEKEQKRRLHALSVLFIKSRLSSLADELSKLQTNCDVCGFVKEELAKDEKDVNSYFRFFDFLSDIIIERYRVRLKSVKAGFIPSPKPLIQTDIDPADLTNVDLFDGNDKAYDDIEQSKTQAELVSFLTLKKELFEIQNVEDWDASTVEVGSKSSKALFFEPTIVQLPVNANLMKKATPQTKAALISSDKSHSSPDLNPTKYYFFLPGLVDLSYWCPPVEDQEDVNACTAFAGVSLLEYFAQKRYGKYTNLSARFLYKTARNLMNRSDDTGASVRQTMKALVLFGVPPEEVWPWHAAGFNEEPPAFCYAYAQSYQALKYFRLDAAGSGPKDASLTSRELLLFQIKAVLAAGLPCIFGFTIYSSFFKDRNIRFGYVSYPSSRDQVVGGHTAVAVGYNDHKRIERMDGKPAKRGAILIRNSWGPNWGNGGYGWMPYEYVLDGLTADWWSLLKSEWFDGGAFGLGAVDPGNVNKQNGSQIP